MAGEGRRNLNGKVCVPVGWRREIRLNELLDYIDEVKHMTIGT